VSGRPRRRHAAIAAPTSAGSGSRSARLPLPLTVISPRRHSNAFTITFGDRWPAAETY
jgi:hypothetical protein